LIAHVFVPKDNYGTQEVEVKESQFETSLGKTNKQTNKKKTKLARPYIKKQTGKLAVVSHT
jgi:hypothetical protein